jgi:dienelactone hydrolase
MIWLALLACADSEKSAGPGDSASPGVDYESVVLPDDPAARGLPVGVRTLTTGEQTFEIWYPAADNSADLPTEMADFDQFVPQSFIDRVGEFEMPTMDTGAIRDGAPRAVEEPFPVVIFSHGFGGFRLQSIDYAVHLASRGYVVMAADHPGRTMADVLPCLFSPPADGCDLSGFGSDPAVEDVQELMDWVEATEGTEWHGVIDRERIALSGHSAGGGTTQTLGESDPRFDALLSMAAGARVDRDVPTLLMDGTCDGIVTTESVTAAYEGLQDGALVHVLGAGHLAFSDLCTLDLAGIAEELLTGRDDLNTAIYTQLLLLASDGCPGSAPLVERAECEGACLPLEDSAPIIRHYSTVFFDAELKGIGPGLADGLYADAELILP